MYPNDLLKHGKDKTLGFSIYLDLYVYVDFKVC